MKKAAWHHYKNMGMRLEHMGMSTKDLSRKHANMKVKIAELEVKARMDPLKKHPEVHDELAKLKKKLAED